MVNKLHVALVHDTIVPAFKYGGTERVLWWLAKALYELGHKVSIIVPEGSTCSFADIISRPKSDTRVDNLIPKDAHIVHSFATLTEKLSKPLIVTIGGNGQQGERFHPNTVFVSENHAKRHNSEAFVHNGLDPADYDPVDLTAKEPFAYFLGKAKWKVKNLKGAVAVAKKAHVPIKIMGGWRPSFSRKVKWLGMLGGEEKNKVLRAGSALLFPVRWHEPFGIAITEALFTGSPVFGTPYGSLPELVNKDCGFLATSVSSLADALKNYKDFNPETCRNYVLKNLTYKHMAQKYLGYYEHILKGKQLSQDEPRALTKTSPQDLLDFSFD